MNGLNWKLGERAKQAAAAKKSTSGSEWSNFSESRIYVSRDDDGGE